MNIEITDEQGALLYYILRLYLEINSEQGLLWQNKCLNDVIMNNKSDVLELIGLFAPSWMDKE